MWKLFLTVMLVLPVAVGAHPHNYTEQQAQLSIGLNVVYLTVVIVPAAGDGTAIFSHIDVNKDGVISTEETNAFGDSVLSNAQLTVDGVPYRFTNPYVTISTKEQSPSDASRITLETSREISLLNNKSNKIDFRISYGEFSHSWFVQPFFYSDILKATELPSIDRTKGGGNVTVRFNRRGTNN